jgi:hypothetical protein
MAAVTMLGFTIRSSWDGSGTRGAERGLLAVGAAANAANKRFGGASAGMLNLAAAATAAAPSMIPLSSAIAGVGVASASMAVSAGSAFGIYGAAMYGAIKREHAGYDPQGCDDRSSGHHRWNRPIEAGS